MTGGNTMQCRACGTPNVKPTCRRCGTVSFDAPGTDYAHEYNERDTTYNQWLANVDALHTTRAMEAHLWGPHLPPLLRLLRREYAPRTTRILDYGCGQGC